MRRWFVKGFAFGFRLDAAIIPRGPLPVPFRNALGSSFGFACGDALGFCLFKLDGKVGFGFTPTSE